LSVKANGSRASLITRLRAWHVTQFNQERQIRGSNFSMLEVDRTAGNISPRMLTPFKQHNARHEDGTPRSCLAAHSMGKSAQQRASGVDYAFVDGVLSPAKKRLAFGGIRNSSSNAGGDTAVVRSAAKGDCKATASGDEQHKRRPSYFEQVLSVFTAGGGGGDLRGCDGDTEMDVEDSSPADKENVRASSPQMSPPAARQPVSLRKQQLQRTPGKGRLTFSVFNEVKIIPSRFCEPTPVTSRVFC
jgi:hypothetical protein